MRDGNIEGTAFHPSGENICVSGNRSPGLGSWPFIHHMCSVSFDCLFFFGQVQQEVQKLRHKNGHGSYSHGAYNLEGRRGICI